MSYFAQTAVRQWKFEDAYKSYCDNESSVDSAARRSASLQKMLKDLRMLTKSIEVSKATTAARWIANWAKLKRKAPKEDESMAGSNMEPNCSFTIKRMRDFNVHSFVAGAPTIHPIKKEQASVNTDVDTETSTGSKRKTELLDTQDLSFDKHKRRKYTYDYLESVVLEWNPTARWMLSKKKATKNKNKKLDITEPLVEFRNRTVLLAQHEYNLSDIRVLSLSNVFVITSDLSDSCLRRYLPRYFYAVTNAMDRKKGWRSVPFPVRTWCSLMDELIASHKKFPLKQLRKLVRSFGEASDDFDCNSDYGSESNDINDEVNNVNDGADDDNDEDEDDENTDDRDEGSLTSSDSYNTRCNDDLLSMCAALLTSLVEKFKSWTPNYVLEATFINQSVLPFLDPVFHRHGITTRVGEPHVTKLPNSHMAEYIASHTTSTGSTYDLVAVEIKPPYHSSQSQLESDFVKVGKEMKDMIDDLLELGVDDPCTAGVLVEGLKMTTYTMTLVSEGVYILLEHGQASFLHSPQDIHNVPLIVEHLEQLSVLLEPTRRKINECAMSDGPGNSRQAWQRPSATVPIRKTERKTTADKTS